VVGETATPPSTPPLDTTGSSPQSEIGIIVEGNRLTLENCHNDVESFYHVLVQLYLVRRHIVDWLIVDRQDLIANLQALFHERL